MWIVAQMPIITAASRPLPSRAEMRLIGGMTLGVTVVGRRPNWEILAELARPFDSGLRALAHADAVGGLQDAERAVA